MKYKVPNIIIVSPPSTLNSPPSTLHPQPCTLHPHAPIIFLLLSLFLSCNLSKPEQNQKQYLFLGHPYDWKNDSKVDPRLEKLEYNQYDQVWLGGDVCSQTTKKESTLEYLDRLFDLGANTTHWTLGNHDIQNGNLQWITTRTKRPTFYTDWVDGICLLVLNTNLFWYYDGNPAQDNCAEKEAQVQMIHAVLDTLQSASHLLILHHHGLFNHLMLDDFDEPLSLFNVNAPKIRMTCDSNSFLTTVLYPSLKKVKKKDIEVILVGGDFGMRAKEFSYQTPEGIWLLGSGINNSVSRSNVPDYVTSLDPDKVLVFKHWPEKSQLEWNFVELSQISN